MDCIHMGLRILFRKQASKELTECDSTNKSPRFNIVSDRLLSWYALHQTKFIQTLPYRLQKKAYWWVMYDDNLVCIFCG